MFRGRPCPAPGEEVWTEQDRAEALALLDAEADGCHGCGQPLSETTAPDAEGRYTVDEVMCAGCQVREVVAEREHYRGRMLAVRRKPATAPAPAGDATA